MKLQQISLWPNKLDIKTENRYWLQCELAYTFQPIYRTDGMLMAVEILTVVTHPSMPHKRIPPDRYFSAISARQRSAIVELQMRQLLLHREWFEQNNLLASINVDGPTLQAMSENPRIAELRSTLPWACFELVEYVALPSEEMQENMAEFGPLWLDDFGTGVANFSSLNSSRFDYIKIARDLFMMLRESEEGRNMFTLLLKLMNRYCKGVIVEGVETVDEWRDVQRSPAMAAQGYFLARPMAFDLLEKIPVNLVRQPSPQLQV